MLMLVTQSTFFQEISDLLQSFEHFKRSTVLDVFIVFIIIYEVLKLVRGTRAVQMAAGIVFIAVVFAMANWLGLETLQFLLRNILIYAPFALIVLFQAEIRAALTHFGRFRNPLGFRGRRAELQTATEEIALASATLASQRIGGLIVLERYVGLQNYIDSGVIIGARVSYDLLVTVFNKRTPLHDGAVIIRGDQIAAASCFLPLTLNPRLSKDMGTRHRAAIGMTEDTDAVVVVISEETGIISYVEQGRITKNVDAQRLRELLDQALELPHRQSPASESNRQLNEMRGEKYGTTISRTL